MKLFSILLLLCIISNQLLAQESVKKEYFAGECNKNDITIDGNLNESAWATATWQDDFTQYEPSEGKAPHQKTDFAILLDEHYIYVGFKAWDSSPDSIVQRLSQRDQADGDVVAIEFDSYFDKRTAFAFIVNVAGIKQDFIISNDGENEDNSWDPIWLVKTSRDDKGWYAEMRIPLTQLRFEGGSEQTWGVQVGRALFRKDEVSLWQPSSKKISGWVHQFGELKGLKNLKSRKVADLMPYVVARTDRFKKEPENPFRSSGKKNQLDGGLDGKLGLTNNLTLDFTINPDFGQVEADPSQVNLTSFETFFQEKRPFFIEGKNILSYGLMFGDGDLSSENMFYSRRIGRRPHNGNVEGDYINSPEFTSILGAAKITGKTKTGWSIGLLESITGEEFAHTSTAGTRSSEMVEPFTNYAIARLQKDFDKGNTILGGMLTSVNRNLDDSQPDDLQKLHKTAISGGMDFVHKWHNKDWEFALSNYFSRVEGSPEAITETQRSWIHGFQRPDATHLTLDSTRTSLMGQGGKITIGEYGGKFKFMFATAWKSPGLELNDVGYMRQADNILEVFWMGYRIYEPFSIFRNLNLNFNQWTEWNFAGELTGPGGNINAHTQFTNYWRFDFGTNYNGEGLASAELRGGPALKVAGTKNIWFALGSNEQKKLTAEYQMMALNANVKNSKTIYDFNLSLGYRPSKSLKITVTPSFNINDDELQFVDYPNYTDKATGAKTTDYIFARIAQRTLSASLRINYNITPDLSIQYWGQPFVSSGKYSQFKRITDSRADEYTDRFSLLSNQELTFIESQDKDSKGTYVVNDAGGEELYRFDQPDFNSKEFLSNMVIRWEYLPGSTIYLVWSQTRHNPQFNGPFNFNRDLTALFNKYPENVFLMKMSIRIGR